MQLAIPHIRCVWAISHSKNKPALCSNVSGPTICVWLGVNKMSIVCTHQPTSYSFCLFVPLLTSFCPAWCQHMPQHRPQQYLNTSETCMWINWYYIAGDLFWRRALAHVSDVYLHSAHIWFMASSLSSLQYASRMREDYVKYLQWPSAVYLTHIEWQCLIFNFGWCIYIYYFQPSLNTSQHLADH